MLRIFSRFVFGVAVLLFGAGLPAQALMGWKKVNEYSDTSFYRTAAHSGVSIVKAKPTQRPTDFSKQQLMQLETSKSAALQRLGIRDRRTYDFQVSRVGEATLVIFSGDYFSSNTSQGTGTIYFKELHIYSPKARIQLLLTNTQKNKLNQDAKNLSVPRVLHEIKI